MGHFWGIETITPGKEPTMKMLYVALIASTLTAPVMAMDLSVLTKPTATEDFGRRSGRCPNKPEAVVLPGQVIGREGSACGGV